MNLKVDVEYQDYATAFAEFVRERGTLLPDYTMDGGEHQISSQVLEWLEASTRFDRLTPGAAVQTGDLACFRMGRVPHHVGLVLQPPIFIHAMRNYGVIESRLDDPTFAKRLMAVYRPVQ